jgi:hypothetical protein
VTRVRIVLVGVPRLLGEIVAGALDGRPDVAVVGNEGDLADAVQGTGAEVVVVSEESAEPETIAELIGHHPEVRVIGVSADGRHAYAYRPQRVALGELSSEGLREAIRG